MPFIFSPLATPDTPFSPFTLPPPPLTRHYCRRYCHAITPRRAFVTSSPMLPPIALFRHASISPPPMPLIFRRLFAYAAAFCRFER
jgi:hypothetical protein